MKHNNITMITLITSLLIPTITNAQNFYTCVPKDDWFNKKFDTRMLYEKFETAKTQINDNRMWQLIASNQTKGFLEKGVYKVVVAGGSGGNGGGAGPSSCGWDSSGGSGGNGHVEREVLILLKKSSFTAVIGSRGYDGSNGGKVWRGSSRGTNGGNGGSSELNIIDVQKYTAAGGGGGYGGWAHSCDSANGSNGYSAGNGQNGGWGYVYIYKYIG